MQHIDAIYQHGVFKPLGPVPLVEDQRVRLSFESVDKESLRAWMKRAEALQAEIIERHGVLPDSAPDIAADRLR